MARKKKLNKAIKNLDEMLDSGVEWSNQKLKKAHIDLRKWLKELRNYRKLEKQRRLLKLPCVVGDTVYYADNEYYFAVIPVKIDEIGIIDPSTILYRGIFFDGNGCVESEFDYNDDDFGKIVFPTRQEAEEALERMKGAKA